MKHTVSLLMLALFLVSCGSDNGNPTRSTPPPPTTPAAGITVVGKGTVTIHPSIDRRFCCAVRFPMSIEETSGGTAIWAFFRVQYLKGATEIERYEVGADPIAAEGYRNIAARSSTSVSITTRVNTSDFDGIRLVAGFIDNKDARTFEANLSLTSFDGVRVSPVPAEIPDESAFTIDELN